MDDLLLKENERLAQKIRILEEENSYLSERAEEGLLFGMVTENIQNLTDQNKIIEAVLERISILKNIPYVTCGEMIGNKLNPVASYAAFSDQLNIGYPILLQKEVIDELMHGAVVVKDSSHLVCNFHKEVFQPSTAAAIPFKSHTISNGLFVFIDDDVSFDRLTPMLILLNQIVDMTVGKFENSILLKELERVNKELEYNVKKRTIELVTANRSLKKEIAEHKQAEDALKESEERLLSVFRAAPTGIGVVIDRVLKTVNLQLCVMTGYSKKELTDQNARMLYPSDEEYEYVGREKYEQIRDRGTGTVETLWKRKDGNIINVLLSSTPMNLDDLSKGVTFTALDITDRKRAEEALREEKKFTETALNAQQDTFFLFEPTTGKAIRWNRAFNDITGYTDEEIAGMVAPDSYYGPENLKRAYISIEEVLQTGSSTIELELICKDGRKISTEYKTSAIKNKEGKPKYFISIGRDITDYNRAEEEKRKALEFTAEQSKHALIGQVAGKMAHDFNNVLMGIMGNAQLALINCDDEEIKEKLERIDEFAERGREITHNLMSFSKDQEPKQTYFKIEDKIELVLKMFEKDLAGIKVSRNYKPGIPELLADPGMIQDVLVNLIQNSIHAMSKVGNPTLNLKAYSNEGKVYFKVEDNGCGIPKEHQDSIYTPSFTLKGSHDKTGSYKSEIKGTGYGMSNVKKYIVEKHKGDIYLESEIGKGTKITIALRIIKNQLSSDEKKVIAKSQIYDKRRILLVEDESAITDVQYQILTREPFSHIVSTAVNGKMAIDIFDRNKFDVVSLDYMLPGNINGLDVYNHIRKNDKDIPVMFISGNIEFIESMKELREKDTNLEHLSKPVDNLDYVNKINELIGRSMK